RLDEAGKIGWMKLFVRGDQADHLLGCGPKARVQRAAIAAWTRIVDDPDVRGFDSQTIGNAAGLVRAAIVDDDDLVIVAHLTQHGDRPFHRMLERRLLVERGNDHGDTWTIWRGAPLAGRGFAQGGCALFSL